METKLSTLRTLKSISLTQEERDLMRAHAARTVMSTPMVVTESFFKRGVQHGLRIALSSMMFVVFIAGSVSAVANNALPGDPLYSFKINVNEEVKGLFLKTPEEKVLWQKNRIENRVSEIQMLAQSNTLTQAKQQKAEHAINNHVDALSVDLTTLSDKSPNTALTVTTSLEQSLKANKTAIENTSLTVNPATAAAIKTVDATLMKVSNQEVQILAKEIDNINAAVTTVTTTSATEPLEAPTPTAAVTQTPATATPSVNTKIITPSTP